MKVETYTVWAISSSEQLKYGPFVPSTVFTGLQAESEANREAKITNRSNNLSGVNALQAYRLIEIISAIKDVASNPWD